MKYFFFILSFFFLSSFSCAQTVSLSSAPAVTKEGTTYLLTLTVDPQKHKEGSTIPLSKISISAGVFKDKTATEPVYAFTTKTPNPQGVYQSRVRTSSLTVNTEYSVRVQIKTDTGEEKLETTFTTTPENTPIKTEQKGGIGSEDGKYELLAPIPGITAILSPELCLNNPTLGYGEFCDLNKFINFLLSFIIGICAVVLVLRLMIQGYVYLTTDVPYLQLGAKKTFFSALMGLLIAVSAYLILNTINPRLVKNDVVLTGANFNIETFEIGGGLGGEFGTWKPIKVRLDKDVYPAAKNASEKTGVSIPFILAIFQQETGGGKNFGKCYWTQSGVMKEDSERKDRTAFKTIMSELGQNPDTTPVSCALRGGGWGGAIGYTQFLPTTWLEQRNEAKGFLGRVPNPWKLEDSLMTSAVYLKNLGAKTNERDAACKYYSGSVCTPRRKVPNEFYGNEVMQKKAGFEKEIERLKKEGKI